MINKHGRSLGSEQCLGLRGWRGSKLTYESLQRAVQASSAHRALPRPTRVEKGSLGEDSFTSTLLKYKCRMFCSIGFYPLCDNVSQALQNSLGLRHCEILSRGARVSPQHRWSHLGVPQPDFNQAFSNQVLCTKLNPWWLQIALILHLELREHKQSMLNCGSMDH